MHHIEDAEEEAITEADYFFSGHIHPAINIKGLGKQSLSFPCFYFTPEYAVLPAFGKFTGTYTMRTEKNDKAFVIVEDSVMPHKK